MNRLKIAGTCDRVRVIAAATVFIWMIVVAIRTANEVSGSPTSADEPRLYLGGIFWAVIGIGLFLAVFLGSRRTD